FKPITLKYLAKSVGADYKGNGDVVIDKIGTLTHCDASSLTFFTNIKYLSGLKDCKAAACIMNPQYTSYAPPGLGIILAENPYALYAHILEFLYPEQTSNAGQISEKAEIASSTKLGTNVTVRPFAVIEDGVEIGDNTVIGAGTVVARNCKIGSGCKIAASVTIAKSLIGDDVTIYPGTKIGQDGFGFANDSGKHIKVKQLGRVIIGNNVEIGANCTIDCGSGPDTAIGDNCIIDNLVQIAHNVEIKQGCVIVAQTGIAGSTKLGNYVVLGGQCGIAGHLHIGDYVQVAAKSGVHKSISPGNVYAGIPAQPIGKWRRLVTMLNNMVREHGNNKTSNN
ncbi:MAG: UDP-3-O-(3-hydroxymyristoyl)glucosamine N-acyltransferase, partial [Pseudomonadota bacterium]